MNILQICHKVPFPPRDGGSIAMYNLAKGLADLGNDIKVLAINTPKNSSPSPTPPKGGERHHAKNPLYQMGGQERRRFPTLMSRPGSGAAGRAIETVYIDTSLKIWDAFTNLFSSESYHIKRFISKDFENKLIEILKNGKFDVIQLESLFVTPYINCIRKYSNAKVVLRAHNVEFEIWERMTAACKNPVKKAYLKLLAKRLRQYELDQLNSYDGLAAITLRDADTFKKMGCKVPITDIPIGMDIPDTLNQLSAPGNQSAAGSRQSAIGNRQSAASSIQHQTSNIQHPTPVVSEPCLPAGRAKLSNIKHQPLNLPTCLPDRQAGQAGIKHHTPSLFHLGSMDWMPNQEAIKWFLDKAWMKVHRKYPDLKFHIAGRNMPKWLKGIKYKNVEIVGEAGDAIQFMSSKSIMIVPLLSGSGMRVKIIEGMALKKTIISTSIGAEGIKYEHLKNILIANSPDEFLEMIGKCVNDKSFCDKIGENARLLIEEHYNNTKIAEKLVEFYKTL